MADLGWNRFLWLEWNGEFLGAEVDRYYRGIHFSGPWCFGLEDETPWRYGPAKLTPPAPLTTTAHYPR